MTLSIKALTDRKEAYRTALSTAGKTSDTLPSKEWIQRMYYAEHSPIRCILYLIEMEIPSWVSTHFVRHKIGVEHYVQSSREDITGEERDVNAMVKHTMIANAQAIINISRKRLCKKASEETRIAWIDVLNHLQDFDEELYNVCVPECVYRGFCPEIKSCGFWKREYASIERLEYISRLGDKIIRC